MAQVKSVPLKQLLSVSAYPLIVVGPPFLAYWLYAGTQNLFLAGFAGTLWFVLLTALFEHLIPFKKEWSTLYSAQNRKDTKINVMYMVSSYLTQEFVVKAVIMAALIPAIAWLAHSQQDSVLARYWPQQWPLFWQVLALFLITDFNDYWLHRTMHEWHHGWAMHKIHHSMEQLNWSASAKLHVLEHFFNNAPRVIVLTLLGVKPEITLVYFMYNNALGFLVHSNIALNTRWLNYILYMPDHHRFHHSQIHREADTNYSGPTIIWDQIFGTFYLPNRNGPEKLGINPDEKIVIGQHSLPIWQSYWQQFKSPFRHWAGMKD
jgi:sterol desaturase/sphingolipid hydroxylase (fatty acid hydroxylase superfamily)